MFLSRYVACANRERKRLPKGFALIFLAASVPWIHGDARAGDGDYRDYGKQTLVLQVVSGKFEDYERVSGYFLMPNKQPYTIDTQINSYSGQGPYPHNSEDHFQPHFRIELKLNDQIRLFGGVYRIARFDETNIKFPAIYLTKNSEFRIDDENIYFIPISVLDKEPGKFDHDLDEAALHRCRTIPYILADKKAGHEGKPKLQLKVFNTRHFPIPDPRVTDAITYKSDLLGVQEVKEDEIIWIGPFPHKVTKIVWPDSKAQLRGWIEIEQRTEVKETEK